MKRRRLCPERVADSCLESAWRDDIPDRVRKHLEQAYEVINNLMARCIATSKVLEVVEAEMAAMKYPLLGDEDPGMGL
jgi:hypothetical protein